LPAGNNWYPGEALTVPRYTERRVDVLGARGRRSFYERLRITPGRLHRAFSYGSALDLLRLDMPTYKYVNDGNT
jgi:alkaline phosphatase D